MTEISLLNAFEFVGVGFLLGAICMAILVAFLLANGYVTTDKFVGMIFESIDEELEL